VASAGSFDYTNNWFEFALQFDFKFSALTLWQRQTDGTWDYKARVACDYFAPSPSNIQVLMTTNTPVNSWIEFDYLSICRPNIVVMGDSIAEGKTLFSPDRTLGLTNEESTWMRHASIYTSLRNNIAVNKGVGSQSSTTITGRIAEATDQTPRVVFLHASSNDEALSIPKATRTTNIESAITSIEAAGAECVLLNAMYGTSGSADNPDLRDYMLDWWNNYAPLLSPAPFLSIDIMQAVLSAGYMNASLTQSDGIHPTQGATGGYGLIGDLIETYDP
jgi:lysophospholipase L1-like esterase